MQSAVTIKKADFDDFNAQEMVHIGISVKDFRNIITHADSLRVTITALYSQPSQPLQFGYSGQGLRCEFTLMTIGTFRGSTVPAASRAQTHDPKRRTSVFNGSDASRATSEMLPPLRTPGRPESRSAETLGGRSERIPSDFGVNRDSEPLFVTRDDDDRQWEPQESRDDDNEILGWDASADNVDSKYLVIVCTLELIRIGYLPTRCSERQRRIWGPENPCQREHCRRWHRSYAESLSGTWRRFWAMFCKLTLLKIRGLFD